MNTKYNWSNVPTDVKILTTDKFGNVAGWVSDYYKPTVQFETLWYGADKLTGEPKYYGLNITTFDNWKYSLEERPKWINKLDN